jgi:DNA-binding NarL/FixJ family response regulator
MHGTALPPEKYLSSGTGRNTRTFIQFPTRALRRIKEAPIPRIVIADDQDFVRRGVRYILETQNEWEIVGEASNGQEAIQLNLQLHPDAIIMDITMPVMNGFEATSEIVKDDPRCKVLILTAHEGPGVWEYAQHSGARGLVVKSRATAELTPALKAIIRGDTYFH